MPSARRIAIVVLGILNFSYNSFAQESWKSLAGESDDEPSWDAKTAFKNTRNPIFALQSLLPPELSPNGLVTTTAATPGLSITSFSKCQQGGTSMDEWSGPRAWWHGWCFLEEQVTESNQCAEYKYGRKVYISDETATKDITQLLKQWERDEKDLFENSVSRDQTLNNNIGQWYIEGMHNSGKCRVYDWKSKSTIYAECGQPNLRVLCQYPVCRDRKGYTECEKLAQLGKCEQNRAWMEDYCQNTCVCHGKTNMVTNAGLSTRMMMSDCTDNHELCNFWNWSGECDKNPLYMHSQCRAACGICDGGRKHTKELTVTEPTHSQCINTHEWCEFWSWLGECENNPLYMKTKCKGACNPDCTDVTDLELCMDVHADCELWSAHGECIKNRGFMMWKCKKSCHSTCKPNETVTY